MPLNLRFDQLSFWLGFLAACLLWWLVSRIRPLVPQWMAQIRLYLDALSQRNFDSVENYLRRETLNTAQRSHIAAPLFALDEILIQPRLLAPPTGQDPDAQPQNPSIASQVIPYLPDWPELVAAFGVPLVSPAQAMLSGRNLAFVGQPGSGRSVALAHLASQIARGEVIFGGNITTVPIYLHALDLQPFLPSEEDPWGSLTKAATACASRMMQPQIPRYLKASAREKSRKIVLLLDGLDEFPAARLTEMVAFLSATLKKVPRLQVITTASSDALDGLTRAGFYPLAVAAWGQAQRDELVQKWGSLWNSQIVAEAKKQVDAAEIDQSLMDLWLSGENACFSPLEWTMRVWGAYAGDLAGNGALVTLDAHLSRFLPSPAFMSALEELAHSMLQSGTPSLSFDKMSSILSAIKVVKPLTAQDGNFASQAAQAGGSVEAVDAAKMKPGKKSRRATMFTQGEQIIESLLAGGVLVEHSGGQVCFSNPVFLGFLSGLKLTYEEASTMIKDLTWQAQNIALGFAAACAEKPDWVYTVIDEPDAPLFHDLLIAARWLRDAPSNAEWRSYIMRSLVTLLQNEAIPTGVRARCIAAFYCSRDPASAKLFKQLLASKSTTIRQIALLGCGATGSAQFLQDIPGLLVDHQPEVRLTACMALAALPGEPALKAVVEILLSGDEEIRQAAAEALALNPGDGHKVLEEASEEEDLLTRRAAVFGLVQVQEPWSQRLLEKMAVADGQWVVRNAAAQALEALQKSSSVIPKPLGSPSEVSWLLTFASKMGMGILPGQPAVDVLLTVLKSGSIEQQISALYYLRDHPDEEIIAAIYGLLYGGEAKVWEPAIHALWWIAVSGTKLPSPVQFGIG